MEAYDASVPCDVVFGSVTKKDPLTVSVGSMEIPGEILSVAEHMRYRTETIKYGLTEKTIVIHTGLDVGDTVVILRKRGGEAYIVIGKL